MKSQQSRLKAVAGKRYWRGDDAALVVEAWSASGQSQMAFARKHGIHVARLRRWAHRLTPGEAPTFHPVEVVLGDLSRAGDDCGLELILRDGRRVSIGPGFDPDLLKQLVRTIESWSC
jgi:hypothetical protein